MDIPTYRAIAAELERDLIVADESEKERGFAYAYGYLRATVRNLAKRINADVEEVISDMAEAERLARQEEGLDFDSATQCCSGTCCGDGPCACD